MKTLKDFEDSDYYLDRLNEMMKNIDDLSSGLLDIDCRDFIKNNPKGFMRYLLDDLIFSYKKEKFKDNKIQKLSDTIEKKNAEIKVIMSLYSNITAAYNDVKKDFDVVSKKYDNLIYESVTMAAYNIVYNALEEANKEIKTLKEETTSWFRVYKEIAKDSDDLHREVVHLRDDIGMNWKLAYDELVKNHNVLERRNDYLRYEYEEICFKLHESQKQYDTLKNVVKAWIKTINNQKDNIEAFLDERSDPFQEVI